MKNVLKGVIAVIVGILSITLLFGLFNLLFSLILYLILKIPIIGSLIAHSQWIKGCCIELPSAWISYGIGSTIVSKITVSSDSLTKKSLIVTFSIMLGFHILYAIITIIAMFCLPDYDNTLLANIANIFVSSYFIYQSANDNI